MPGMETHTIEPPVDELACPDSCTPSGAEISRFQHAVRTITGKWKIDIICALIDGPRRFGALRRELPGVTQHMLTAQLRELESSGLVLRTAHAELTPRVEYELTDAGYGLIPTFRSLLEWSRQYGGDLETALSRQPAAQTTGRP